MGADVLTIEILADGTIKTTSDAVSAANHDNSERFLKAMARLAGGETTRVARTDVKKSLHGAIHEHAQDGHTHSGGGHGH